MATPLHRVRALGLDVTTASEGALTFDQFFEAEHPRLYASLCLATRRRQDADEIAQEAFVQVFERWDRVATLDDPAGYLHRTAMNLFRKRYRRARLAERLRIPAPSPEDDPFATIDDRDALVRALRHLTQQQRAAVVLTALLDHSSEDAGKMLGISASTVRVLARNACTAMRPNVGDDT